MLQEQVAAMSGPGRPAALARELRELGIGSQILHSLGIRRITLLTNNTQEMPGINAFQLEIAPILSPPGPAPLQIINVWVPIRSVPVLSDASASGDRAG